MEEGKTLNIFDFDGTVFRSPVPNPKLWDSSLYGKIKSTVDSGGFGWFQDVLTLSEPFVPLLPGEEWFVAHVIEAVIQSMNNPNCITVLLTGRNLKYKDIVLNIVQCAKLTFDEYIFKPFGDDDGKSPVTLTFKQETISELVRKYNPTKITMWEDRPNHVKLLKNFLKNKFSNLDCDVIHVDPPGETFLPLNIEMELMQKLRENCGHSIEWEELLLYTAVVLDTESIQLLRERFPPIQGWTEYYHHMTICLGSLDTLHNFSITREAIGKTVKLQVIGFSKNEVVYTVLVSGYPSVNLYPHITLCVPPDGHPKNSNFIKEWTMIEGPDIFVTGQVTEVKKFQLVHQPRAKRVTKKINLGKLIYENTNNKGKQISNTIEKVTKWMEEQNLELSEENTDVVLEYLKEHFPKLK